MTDPAIITVDRKAVRGIIRNGKPQGLYMAMSEVFPKLWTGVDSRPGHLAVMKHGTFPKVLDWLMVRGGIIKERRTVLNRVMDPDDGFAGITVTREGIRRRPRDELRRAKRYTGFSVYTRTAGWTTGGGTTDRGQPEA